MSIQTLHREEFFPTERTEPPSDEGQHKWKVQPVRHSKKHAINVTNEKQDKMTVNFINVTLDHVEDHDNSVSDTEQTKVNKTCKIRGKRIRRGGRNKKHMSRHCSRNLKIFSTNAASVINGKRESLKSEVLCTKSNVITLQETLAKKKGNIQIPNVIVFKAIRTKKGGGTLIAAHEDLNPILISEYSDEFELLVVEVETKKNSIRIISGYGPQENWEEEKRLPFFLALEIEIEKTELAGKSIVIEIDANSNLGPDYIPSDPHKMSPNGFLLSGIIKRHALFVANGSEKSQGTITRRRVTQGRTEESIIDIVMFSHDMNPHFKSLKVDEEKCHVLKSIRKTKRGIKVKESDHHVLETEFNYEIMNENQKQKQEFFNLRNKACMKDFKEYTSKNNMLSSIFDRDEDLNVLTEKFIKKLNGCISKTFRKTRVSGKKKNKTELLWKKLSELESKVNNDDLDEINKVKNKIAEDAEDNYNKLKTMLDSMEVKEGGLNPNQLWKLKKKLCPESRDTPCAMLDDNGNLLTSNKAIKERAVKVYSKRLEANTIKDNMKDLELETNKLCESRMNECRKNVTGPWDQEDLKIVLKQLSNNRSRDPEGLANELF